MSSSFVVVSFRLLPWVPSGALTVPVPASMMLREYLPYLPRELLPNGQAASHGGGAACATALLYAHGEPAPLDSTFGDAVVTGQALFVVFDGAPCRSFVRPPAAVTANAGSSEARHLGDLLLQCEGPRRAICSYLGALDLVRVAATCQRAYRGVHESGAWLEGVNTTGVRGVVVPANPERGLAPAVPGGRVAIAPNAASAPVDRARATLVMLAIQEQQPQRVIDPVVAGATPYDGPREAMSAATLRPGHLVDALDTMGRWYPAVVYDVDRDAGSVSITYWGWTRRWDEPIAAGAIRERLAPRGAEYTHWFVPKIDVAVYAVDPRLGPALLEQVVSAPGALCAGVAGATSAATMGVGGEAGAALLRAVPEALTQARTQQAPLHPARARHMPPAADADPTLLHCTSLVSSQELTAFARRLWRGEKNQRIETEASGIPCAVVVTTPVRHGQANELSSRSQCIVLPRAVIVQTFTGYGRSTFFEHQIQHGYYLNGVAKSAPDERISDHQFLRRTANYAPAALDGGGSPLPPSLAAASLTRPLPNNAAAS